MSNADILGLTFLFLSIAWAVLMAWIRYRYSYKSRQNETPMQRRSYVMSESGLGRYSLEIGFHNLEDLQAAYSYMCDLPHKSGEKQP